MEDSSNSDKIHDQLKKLLYQIKDTDQNEMEVDINLQIFNVNKTEKD